MYKILLKHWFSKILWIRALRHIYIYIYLKWKSHQHLNAETHSRKGRKRASHCHMFLECSLPYLQNPNAKTVCRTCHPLRIVFFNTRSALSLSYLGAARAAPAQRRHLLCHAARKSYFSHNSSALSLSGWVRWLLFHVLQVCPLVQLIQ